MKQKDLIIMGFFKCLFAAVIFSFLLFHANATNVTHDSRAIIIDGVHRVLISGAIHYPRSTAQMWPDLIRKSKEGGLDTIETYVFWNAHEPARRQYDFSGNLDLIRFLKTIQDQGLYAVLRIGPYVCAEWTYGGIPMWVHNLPGVAIRTYNDVFMNEMQNFTTLIVNMVKKERLFASQGGPIILAQIENEYGDVIEAYGEAGLAYSKWCAQMADSLGIGVPWVMCKQENAPEPMLQTCNGFYCHDYRPKNPKTPKMWTENWTGWFKSWGGPNPHRTAEDLAFSVARFYQTGGTFQNYYMYHGGTNFGRTAGGPYMTTSYDYDAVLDEYGNINQPKWGHLKDLHAVLHSMEYVLTHGDVKNTDLGNSVTATVYSTRDKSGCFLSNGHNESDAVVQFGGIDYYIPAWSVSVLPDCKEEAYNTAKIYAQTNVMVKKPNKAEDEPTSLQWAWRPEKIETLTVQGKGDISVNKIVDQKDMANDQSDYLWIITSVELGNDDLLLKGKVTLRVPDNGHILHVYINGEYIGSKWAHYGTNTPFDQKYVFETDVKLKEGRNLITLLSVTVGFKNYGKKYDLIEAGVMSPVELVAHNGGNQTVKDLSNQKWTYKVGLDGVQRKFYDTERPSDLKWSSDNLPTHRNMTWYKTTFKAPLGEKPVVVDLLGLGKGHAWVNSHSLGRYWPSYIANDTQCQLTDSYCDYRGAYYDSKCRSGCGQPSQRWYHVPRSFLKDGENTLVLFEEFGGDPQGVKFETVEVGATCVNAHAGKTVGLCCYDRTISRIAFASFGNPQGQCGSFSKGECESSSDVAKIIEKECVGKESCTFEVSERKFGKTYCNIKRLAVEAIC